MSHASLRQLADECVHCGFCLPSCPTYVLWSEEMDSPRGRIDLIGGRLDGTVGLTPTVVEHFDRCLGCMACLTSCPSGVAYDELLEATRAEIEIEVERSPAERMTRELLFRLLPYPRRLRAALRLEPLGRRSPLPAALAPLRDLAPRWRSGELPQAAAPVGREPVARAGLLLGCVQRVVFGDVNAATARVLVAEGLSVEVPPGQGCCGALSIHSGRLEEGRQRARELIDAFDDGDLDVIAVNAAGCGSSMKEYGRLLADDPAYAERAERFAARVRDVSEIVAEFGGTATRHPLPVAVAFQDSCHLLHAQRVQAEPRAMLGGIPQLVVCEPAEQTLCCGSAGLYNVLQPAAARELGDRKAGNVLAERPDVYASANPGCLIQVAGALQRAGRALPALHPIELLDASIAGRAARDLLIEARR